MPQIKSIVNTFFSCLRFYSEKRLSIPIAGKLFYAVFNSWQVVQTTTQKIGQHHVYSIRDQEVCGRKALFHL